MKTSHINRYIFFTGLITIVLSVLMFLFGIQMFTSSGNFSKFTIKLSEFSFAFWLPFLIIGFILLIIGIILTIYKSNK